MNIYSKKKLKMKSFKLSLISVLILILSMNVSKSETSDCFESVNRAVFSFNMALDKIIFKPVAKGYSYLPAPIQTGVKNATNNVSYLIQIPNQFLQGEFKKGINDTGRFIVNSTVGLLGLFDPASKIGFKKNENEDYGQTLGSWGVGQGCYLMLPVLGPSTLRDSVGKIGNTLLDPFYLSTVGDKELLLGNNLGDQTYWGETALDKTNWRAENLNNLDNLEKNSVDLYASVRSLYLQRREYLVNNGVSASNDDWKDFK